jgi:hypothetical protein
MTVPLGVTQVRDRRTSPAGLLPKNTQAWVIGGLALVMVIIIAFSGSNPPAKAGPQTPIPSQPDPARIGEYEKRLDDLTRRIEKEQADLRKSQVFDLSRPELGFGESKFEYERARSREPDTRSLANEKARDESLFSTNIAFTRRKDNTSMPATPELSIESLTKLMPLIAALSAIQGSGNGVAPPKPAEPVAGASQPKRKARRPPLQTVRRTASLKELSSRWF